MIYLPEATHSYFSSLILGKGWPTRIAERLFISLEFFLRSQNVPPGYDLNTQPLIDSWLENRLSLTPVEAPAKPSRKKKTQ